MSARGSTDPAGFPRAHAGAAEWLPDVVPLTPVPPLRLAQPPVGLAALPDRPTAVHQAPPAGEPAAAPPTVGRALVAPLRDATGPDPAGAERLADRITEDALQLVYVVLQELADVPVSFENRGHACRTHLVEATAILRGVADDLRSPLAIPTTGRRNDA